MRRWICFDRLALSQNSYIRFIKVFNLVQESLTDLRLVNGKFDEVRCECINGLDEIVGFPILLEVKKQFTVSILLSFDFHQVPVHKLR